MTRGSVAGDGFTRGRAHRPCVACSPGSRALCNSLRSCAFCLFLVAAFVRLPPDESVQKLRWCAVPAKSCFRVTYVGRFGPGTLLLFAASLRFFRPLTALLCISLRSALARLLAVQSR
ncbi:hypothetical protein sr10258 [Sporisorium reilianum SRZ2]|uniref:Uncharacterized protein n=1 Tax=Sporisorium reilianum (strain SRZ2) TaxID=999809 RepID=E6ZTN2_SPORE|nr:hypothetical protein sr10258 [Sporisorium reilianum SRZ2]